MNCWFLHKNSEVKKVFRILIALSIPTIIEQVFSTLLLTNSLEAAFLGSKMLKIVAFSEPFFGLMIVMEGIFYGLGHTKYAFFVETFCM